MLTCLSPTSAALSGCSPPSTLLPALQGPLGTVNPQIGESIPSTPVPSFQALVSEAQTSISPARPPATHPHLSGLSGLTVCPLSSRSPLGLHIGFPTDTPKSSPHSVTASSSSVPALTPGFSRHSPPSPLCRSLSPGTGGGVRGGVSYLSRGDPVRVLARRVRPDGSVQYLVEWGGGGIF